MKNKRSRIGLSILAGGLSFVGAANATDLIVNGGFETPYSSPGGGWQYFTQYTHGDAYYDGPDIPASENPGTYYASCPSMAFSDWDHFTTPNTLDYMFTTAFPYAAQQRVDLTVAVSPADIDAGLGQYTFSCWLASYGTSYNNNGVGNPEQPFVYVQFFSNATGEPAPADFISTPAIFDRCTSTYAVTFADGTTSFPFDLSADHQWIKYVAAGSIPVGARQAKVFLTRSPNAAKVNSPDTYIDLVKLDITGATTIAPHITVPPASQTAALGNSVSFSVTATGTSPAYQWRHNGTNVPDSTSSALVLPVVQMTNAGSYDVVVSNSAGSVTSSPPVAVLTVINPQVFVTGQWDFRVANLAATYGADLQDNGAAGDTSFGTTTSLGIPDINGVATPVMHFTPSTPVGDPWGGYKMYHGAAPNGGGSFVNQYTLIYDIYYPASSDLTWRSLLQTDTSNGTDGDLFVDNAVNGIGISSIYNGNVTAGAWHRLAFAIDLTGTETGTATMPVIAKFVDGVKVGNQTAGLDGGMDGRWSLDSYALLFADNDGDVAEAYVSSVQFSNGRRPDAFVEALGGPSALKIPGVIKASVTGGVVTITWTGGVALESADRATGPWTTVGGTAGQSSYTPTPLGTAKLYRPKIL